MVDLLPHYLYTNAWYNIQYHISSEDIELTKCPSDIFCRVCKITHILSVIHYTIYGAVCFQFTSFPCEYILCLTIIIKSKVWTINHCLKLGHETMVCAVCLSIFVYNRTWIARVNHRSYTMTSSNGNIFRVIGPLCGEFIGHRWIPRTKASDAEFWCFLWYAPARTADYTIVRLKIWDATAPIMPSQ